MTKDLITRELPSAEIMFAIVGGEPIPAAMLGSLIIALSRDYKALNHGRTLVVSRLETGSLLVFVQDAYNAAQPYLTGGLNLLKGSKAILDFAKSIKESLSSNKKASAAIGCKTGPYRSIESMVKIAAKTGASISIRHRSKEGEEIEVNVNQTQAIEIQQAPYIPHERASFEYLQENSAPKQSLISASSLPFFADRLTQLAHRGLESPDPTISIVVGLLTQAGVGYLVESLAAELESRGLFDLAAAVRAEVQKGQAGTVNKRL